MKFKKEQVRQAYLKKLMGEYKKYSTPKLADGGALERLITPKDQDLIDQYDAMNNPNELQKSLPGNIQALKEIQQEIKSPLEEIKPASASLPDIQVSPKLENEQKIEKEQSPILEEVKPEESLFKQILMEKISQPKQDISSEYTKLLSEIDKQKQEAKSEKQKADWMSALSMISSNLGKTLGTDVGPAMKFEPGTSEENILQNKLSELKLKEMLQPKSPIDDKLLGYLASSERLDFAREKEKQNQEEFQKNLELKQKGFEEKIKQAYLPSSKETETLANFDKTTKLANYIEEDLLPKAEEYIGRYASKIEEAKDVIPFMEQDQNFVALKSAVTEQLSQYIKGLSGLTVSDKERAQLEAAAPKVTDKPETFKTKLSEFKKRLGMLKDTEIKALQGYRERSIENKPEINELDNPKKEIKSNKPKTVIQNGHTYILNEETGEYE